MRANKEPKMDHALHCAYYHIADQIRTRAFGRKVMKDMLPDKERQSNASSEGLKQMAEHLYGGSYPSDWLLSCPDADVLSDQGSPIGGFFAVENGTLFLGVPGPSYGRDVCWMKAAVISCDQCMHAMPSMPSTGYNNFDPNMYPRGSGSDFGGSGFGSGFGDIGKVEFPTPAPIPGFSDIGNVEIPTLPPIPSFG